MWCLIWIKHILINESEIDKIFTTESLFTKTNFFALLKFVTALILQQILQNETDPFIVGCFII